MTTTIPPETDRETLPRQLAHFRSEMDTRNDEIDAMQDNETKALLYGLLCDCRHAVAEAFKELKAVGQVRQEVLDEVGDLMDQLFSTIYDQEALPKPETPKSQPRRERRTHADELDELFPGWRDDPTISTRLI